MRLLFGLGKVTTANQEDVGICADLNDLKVMGQHITRILATLRVHIVSGHILDLVCLALLGEQIVDVHF
jgi:hypothetical protein